MVLLTNIDLEAETPDFAPDDDALVVKTKEGRAAAREAWMWDGTPTVLTLSWNPDGTQHDFGHKYLAKKHCLCCGDSGFKRHCLKCRKNSCSTCRQSTDKSKIIPCFYLNKDDVPYQAKFYGDINCFLPMCARRDSQGFQTEEDMRMHAMSRHAKQYEAHEAVTRSTHDRELDQLRGQVNLLLAAQVAPTEEAPLYVSDKPTEPKKTRKSKKNRE